MVLGKLPVPGRPTTLEDSRARAYCACSRYGRVLPGHFSLVYHFSFLSPALWETSRCRLEKMSQGPLNTEQPNNKQYCKNVPPRVDMFLPFTVKLFSGIRKIRY